MTAVLKASMGEAAAFLSDDHGEDNLLKVLTALAGGSERLTYFQATPSTGDKARTLTTEATKLTALSLKMGTTGDANDTDLDVEVDGNVVASVSINNAEADGTVKSADLSTPVDIPAGSTVELVVSAVTTNPANGEATAVLSPLSVE